MNKKLNKFIRIISKKFLISKELLYISLKYDSRFYAILDVACDFNVNAKRLCNHLRNNSDSFQINFNQEDY